LLVLLKEGKIDHKQEESTNPKGPAFGSRPFCSWS
jgi:hypothetical protein